MTEEAPALKPEEKSGFIIEAKNKPQCPECGSKRLYRDGLRYLANDQTVQRWLCRDCGYRFSWPRAERRERESLKNNKGYISSGCSSRVMALLERRLEGPMNNAEEKAKSGHAGATATDKADVKGKIVEFGWWMKKQGFSEHTIKNYMEMLKLLANSGAKLQEPESVKETLAKLGKSDSWKHAAVCAYSLFAEMHGLTWQKPKV
ncbi:hypothetical protein H5T51_04925, partial [Candidatus Bathyarchaeota archaeon]|nr:hypothetical protein [Candidatus Bathyarchaeota archaeon]